MRVLDLGSIRGCRTNASAAVLVRNCVGFTVVLPERNQKEQTILTHAYTG